MTKSPRRINTLRSIPALKNKIYDNGGCRGCHGVAQTDSAQTSVLSWILATINLRLGRPQFITTPRAAWAAKPSALKHYLDQIRP
jgi:hypothetical protein